jgi:diadenosine tetraphosphate (Ap4A) HIT family hydrolase
MRDDVFSKIVRGELPCHKVWEDEHHLAFLSIFPNTEGVTVVIPKDYQPSNVWKVAPVRLTQLMDAVRTVAEKLVRAFPDCDRPALVFEGFGVDYLHAKLFPMHGTAGEWRPIHGAITTWYDEYPGYISSHDAARADDMHLATVAAHIAQA